MISVWECLRCGNKFDVNSDQPGKIIEICHQPNDLKITNRIDIPPAPPKDLNLQELTMEGQTVLNGEDKGKKYDGGKPMVQLLSPTAMIKIAEVMTFGAKKYGSDNWREGIAWTRVIGAVLRHIFAWIGGQDRDPETGISHLAHAGCGIMFLLEYEETRKEKDDRYKKK